MEIGQSTTYKKSFSQDEFDQFAELSGDHNPIHIDPEFSARTKFGKTVAHGMLLYSTIVRSQQALMPGTGLIQLSQELMFPNPTFVGEEIEFRLEVTALPSSTKADIKATVSRSDNTPVCLGTSQVGVSGTDIEFYGAYFEIPSYKSEVEEHRGLYIGQSAEKNRVFSQDDLGGFFNLVDESNPLYTNPEYARSVGLRDNLIPGGLAGGSVSDLLGTRLPGYGTNWLKQKYYFLKPVYPGDEITTRVEIIRLRAEKDLINLRTTLANQNGLIVVDGEATVWVSDLEM